MRRVFWLGLLAVVLAGCGAFEFQDDDVYFPVANVVMVAGEENPKLVFSLDGDSLWSLDLIPDKRIIGNWKLGEGMICVTGQNEIQFYNSDGSLEIAGTYKWIQGATLLVYLPDGSTELLGFVFASTPDIAILLVEKDDTYAMYPVYRQKVFQGGEREQIL